MECLTKVTEEKVYNRLFKLMEKIVKDLKKPAKDKDGHWEVSFFDGLVFTTPKSETIPSLVTIDIDRTSSYVKPVLDILDKVNFSIDILELEPMLEYLTKAQQPEVVELYDDQINIVLPNGTSRTFKVNPTAVQLYNETCDDLETKYTPTLITSHPASHTFLDDSFGGRGDTNILEINMDLATGKVYSKNYLPDGVNVRLLRKNMVGVVKKTKKIPGTTDKETTYSPTTFDFLESTVKTDRGCLKVTVDNPYYKVEQLYIVYKV